MTWDEATSRIKRSDLPALRLALDEGLDPNLSHRFGWSLLMVAASEGVTDAGRLLIESGADINYSIDHFLGCALALAVHEAHLGFVRMLIQKGASLEPLGDWEASREWFLKHSKNTELTLSKIYSLLEEARLRSKL